MMDDYLVDTTDHMTTDAGTFRASFYVDPVLADFDDEDVPEDGYFSYMIERLVDPYGDVDPDDEAAQWEHVDSLWAIDDYQYAEELAAEMISHYRPEHFVSPVLAMQA